MSSACQCHVEGAFCFYCEVYAPVVAENERLRMQLARYVEQDGDVPLEVAGKYLRHIRKYLEALREIDTHTRATSDPIPHIVTTLKRVLPEYNEEVGADE